MESFNDASDYNIPRKIRELQFWGGAPMRFLIITYQEKLGNYNPHGATQGRTGL